MNAIVILSALLAIAAAKPTGEGSVSLTQDTAGNYKLAYNTPDASRDEHGSQDGKVVGSYTFHDKEGSLHTIKYISAPGIGYVATGDVPVPVQETPEVAAVRAHHLAVVHHERSILPLLKEEYAVEVPHHVHTPVHTIELPIVHHTHHHTTKVIVDNTAEIEAAKAEHFAAHHVALARLAEEYRKVTV